MRDISIIEIRCDVLESEFSPTLELMKLSLPFMIHFYSAGGISFAFAFAGIDKSGTGFNLADQTINERIEFCGLIFLHKRRFTNLIQCRS